MKSATVDMSATHKKHHRPYNLTPLSGANVATHKPRRKIPLVAWRGESPYVGFHKRYLPRRIFHLVVVGLLCLGAGIVVGQIQDRSTNVLLKKRESINTIPREYGWLVAVERSSEGTMLYFEAEDGTIHFVTVIYGIDYGSLKFKTVTVPRR